MARNRTRTNRVNSGQLLRRAELHASGLPPLLVEAEQVAATIAQGVHGRRRVGQGETFWQFRRYQSGDPARSIDWRRSAKTSRLFVREYEWEAAETVWLWCDPSASMRYASDSGQPEKMRRAITILLALASLLVRAGEHVSLLGEDMMPSHSRTILLRMADDLARALDAEPDPSRLSLPEARQLPRHAQLVLIGDFLSPLEEIERLVMGFARLGLRGHLMQILDPAEKSLPFDGLVRFEGLEDDGTALIKKVDGIRPNYQARLEAQMQGLADLAAAAGWTYAHHVTDRPPQTALLALYQALAGADEAA